MTHVSRLSQNVEIWKNRKIWAFELSTIYSVAIRRHISPRCRFFLPYLGTFFLDILPSQVFLLHMKKNTVYTKIQIHLDLENGSSLHCPSSLWTYASINWQRLPRSLFCANCILLLGRVSKNEINKSIKISSQFYHLVKGLLRTKDITRNVNNILKIYFKRNKKSG